MRLGIALGMDMKIRHVNGAWRWDMGMGLVIRHIDKPWRRGKGMDIKACD